MSGDKRVVTDPERAELVKGIAWMLAFLPIPEVAARAWISQEFLQRVYWSVSRGLAVDALDLAEIRRLDKTVALFAATHEPVEAES